MKVLLRLPLLGSRVSAAGWRFPSASDKVTHTANEVDVFHTSLLHRRLHIETHHQSLKHTH